MVGEESYWVTVGKSVGVARWIDRVGTDVDTNNLGVGAFIRGVKDATGTGVRKTPTPWVQAPRVVNSSNKTNSNPCR